MVQSHDAYHDLSKNEYLVAGAISGLISRAVVQPLDVLKIRFQLQVEPIKASNTSKYHGLVQAIRCINQEEGVWAFWKGHVPAQVQAITFAGIQFLSFEIFMSWLPVVNKIIKPSGSEYTTHFRVSPIVNFTCGCLAGTVAAALTQPLDVMRTRFIAQGEPKIYNSMLNAAVFIGSREGLRGFFRGLVPTVLLIAPQTGMQFAIYHSFNSWIDALCRRFHLKAYSADSDDFPRQRVGPIQSLIAGGLAGMSAKCIVYPLDVAKKRMQVRGFEEARLNFGKVPNFNGLRGCLMEIWRKEGAAAIFKGLRPTLLKSFLSISCRFTVYEQLCILFTKSHCNINSQRNI